MTIDKRYPFYTSVIKILCLMLIYANAWAIDYGCSDYMGRATLNEFYKDDGQSADKDEDFVEVKILDGSIEENTFETWKIRMCEKNIAGNSVKNDEDGCSANISLSDFTRKTKPWIVLEGSSPDHDISYINMKSGFEAILLDDENKVIDYVTAGYQDSTITPTAGCMPISSYPFDTDVDWEGNSYKTIMRREDGTGDWDGAEAASFPGTVDTTNDVIPDGTTELPLVIIDDVNVVPGGNAIFTVSIYGYYNIATEIIDTTSTINKAAGAIQIAYKTNDGTATSASLDYTAIATATVSIASGATSGTFSVNTNNSASVDENFFIQLTEVTSSETIPAVIYDTYGKATFIAPSGPDHYSISHSNTGITCEAQLVTITAHDASHNPVNLTSNASITITTSPTVDSINSSPLSILTGNSSATFYITETSPTSDININVTDGSSTESSGSAETNPSNPNYDDKRLTFVDSLWQFTTDKNSPPTTTINTQTSGQSTTTAGESHYLRAVKTADLNGSPVCVSALDAGTHNIPLGYQCIDPSTCSVDEFKIYNNQTFVDGSSTTLAHNDGIATTNSTNVALAFDANGYADLSFVYSNVGEIALFANGYTLNGASVTGNSSNQFVVKPYSLVLTDIKQTASPYTANPAATGASGNLFVKAGEAFSATVTAVNASCAANLASYTLLSEIPSTCITNNYGRETAPEGVTLSSALVAGLGLTENPALDNQDSFGSFSDGSATGTTFGWKEVGIIKLTPSIGGGDYLGAGDVTGTPSPNIGRFYPSHFSTATSNGSFADKCTTGTTDFTYLGEYFTYDTQPTIITTAKSVGGSTTENYTGDFAKLTTAEISLSYPTEDNAKLDEDGVNKILVTPANTSLGRTDNGNGTLTFTLAGGGTADIFTYQQSKGMVTPFDSDLTIKLTAVADSDGVSANDLSSPKEITPAGNRNRFGRGYAIDSYSSSSAIGSTLPVSIGTQYLDDSGSWFSNTDDSCSQYTYSPPTDNGITTTIAPPSPITLSGGTGDLTLTLTADASPTGGKTTIDTTFDSWLQSDLDGVDQLTDSDLYDDNPSATATFGSFRGDDRILYWQEVEQ